MVLPLILMLIAACAGEAGPRGAAVEFKEPKETQEPSFSPAPGAAGSSILNFTAPKLGGGQVVGTELAGQNVAVWFWAPW